VEKLHMNKGKEKRRRRRNEKKKQELNRRSCATQNGFKGTVSRDF
jgi:hypothetical protein